MTFSSTEKRGWNAVMASLAAFALVARNTVFDDHDRTGARFIRSLAAATTVLLGLWGLVATAALVGWWTWLARTLPRGC